MMNNNKYTFTYISRILFIFFVLFLAFLLIRKYKHNSTNNAGNFTEDYAVSNGAVSVVPTIMPTPDSSNIMPDTIDPDKPMIALTFDDGPNTSTTGSILDTLETHNARATFFVVSSRLPAHYDASNRALSIGCEIGSHSYSHKMLNKLKTKQIKKEFKRSKKIIKKYTGNTFSLIRTPYGDTDRRVLKNTDYPVVLWSVDSLDWKAKNSKVIVNRVMKNAKDGDIILLHDLYTNTAEAVKEIVPALISQGYQLVTVSEMMEAKGIKLKNGHTYGSAR
ncbi:MAG: hypothetical protein E7267_04005 [Lachnospiraceae bacterium]|nr:hypothetical protein [Lachnospiraceae bacterium]